MYMDDYNITWQLCIHCWKHCNKQLLSLWSSIVATYLLTMEFFSKINTETCPKKENTSVQWMDTPLGADAGKRLHHGLLLREVKGLCTYLPNINLIVGCQLMHELLWGMQRYCFQSFWWRTHAWSICSGNWLKYSTM